MTLTLKSRVSRSLTRRWRNARPGSVLILVVALLVLLALIGTAYLSSTQGERYTSGQNTINTEADLLMQGMIDTINATVSNAVFGNGATGISTFRPPSPIAQPLTGTAATGYNNYTSTNDYYLADRLPSLIGGASVAWNSVSWPPFLDSSSRYAFDSPVGASIELGTGASYVKQGYGPYTVNTDGTLTVGGAKILGADADGDGIPDSGFFKLPVGQIDGITYYAAMRIIDTNSAINVNTALSSVSDFNVMGGPTLTPVDGLGASTTITGSFTPTGGTATVVAQGTMPAGAAALGFFPSHVGLMQILSDYNTATYDSSDMESALRYMSQESATALPPLADGNYIWSSANPDNGGAARADFTFLTVGDHLNSQIARRSGYPGWFTHSGTGIFQHQAFNLNDSAALAAGFCVRNPLLSQSNLELQMPDSLVNNTYVQTAPYTPQNVALWFNSMYYTTYGLPPHLPVRPLLVASNPVSDFIPAHFVDNSGISAALSPVDLPNAVDPLNPQMLPYNPPVFNLSTTYSPGAYVKYQDTASSSGTQPYRCYVALTTTSSKLPVNAGVFDTTDWRLEEAWTDTPEKANINTADFPTLWRAFYNIMADTADTIPPLPGGTITIAYTSPGWGPFRNPVRSATPATPIAGNTMSSGQVMQLRAAIAAVNAIDMRNSDQNVTSRTITLYSDKTHTSPTFTAMVFGVKEQPFITAVVADYDGSKISSLSIELYNPTDAAINVSNWQLAEISRTPSTSGVMALAAISTAPVPAIPNGTTIAAGGYLLIQSDGPPNMDAGPNETVLTPAVTGLGAVADPALPMELVLLRPRRSDGTYGSSAVYDNVYSEGATAKPDLDQLVPVDSIDFTGVFTAGIGGAGRRVYERPHGAVDNMQYYNWKFVYPGKYDAPAGKTAGAPSQTGWGALVTPPGPPPTGGSYSDGTTIGGLNQNNFQAIQLATGNWVGRNPATTAAGNKFPFGGFARNGDMLKVPFIGAYRIKPAVAPVDGEIVEMNPITMDASQATASQATASEPLPLPVGLLANQTRIDEAIGRFCPLAALDPLEAENGMPFNGTNNDPYGWASHFFDYLDVQVSSDDFFPNADPRLADGSMPTNTGAAPNVPTASNPLNYTNSASTTAEPTPVGNASSVSANGDADQTLGKQGLININTASSWILQQLPGVTADMANAIVADRQANGPFKTIFDLNRVGVPATGVMPTSASFQTHGVNDQNTNNIDLYSNNPLPVHADISLADDPTAPQGDFSQPTAVLNDGVRLDFEEKTLMLNRISNLITTRSDEFTCYVLLQGWRGVGTSNPTLAVQRRSAFFLDRNGITSLTNSKPFDFNIPAQ
jgi:hypothetical protein